MRGVRQLDLLDGRAQLLRERHGPPALLRHARVEALLLEPPHAHAHAVQALGRRAGVTPSGCSSEVESHGSRPTSAAVSSAASATLRVSGPHWSSEEAKAIMPWRDTAP